MDNHNSIGGLTQCPPNSTRGNETFHNPPLLFDILFDPAESQPLTQSTFPDYDILQQNISRLLVDLLTSVSKDNTTVANFTEDETVRPCCNPTNIDCSCEPCPHY